MLLVGLAGPGRPAGASDYVGAEICAACHPEAYDDWQASPHAAALARLTPRQQRDAACRGCHTTAPDEDDARLAGVQCESCHGAGRRYAPEYVMRDLELAKLLGLEAVTESTCIACHTADTPSVKRFDFQTMVTLIDHRPAKETPGDASQERPGVEAGGR